MKVNITQKDVENLNKFMLLHSKNAKKQRLISTYAIPLEFLLVGIIIDGLAKTAPYVTIGSVVLGILWLLFYPKFYKKMLAKHLAKTEIMENSNVEMNFEADEKQISFSRSSPSPSEIFETKNLEGISQTDKNYFLAFARGFHIVLPKNAQTDEIISKLCEIRSLAPQDVII